MYRTDMFHSSVKPSPGQAAGAICSALLSAGELSPFPGLSALGFGVSQLADWDPSCPPSQCPHLRHIQLGVNK